LIGEQSVFLKSTETEMEAAAHNPPSEREMTISKREVWLLAVRLFVNVWLIGRRGSLSDVTETPGQMRD